MQSPDPELKLEVFFSAGVLNMKLWSMSTSRPYANTALALPFVYPIVIASLGARRCSVSFNVGDLQLSGGIETDTKLGDFLCGPLCSRPAGAPCS
jgi:hypothetical protein